MKRKLIDTFRKILKNNFGLQLTKIKTITDTIDHYTTIQHILRHYTPVHVCDIGSNNGSWARTLVKYAPGVQSIAFFEPQAKYQEELRGFNFKSIQHHVFSVGLSDQEGEVLLKGGTTAASVLDVNDTLKDNFTGVFKEEQESIQLRRLDSVYAENKLVQPDFIKIDVQGLELEVINGGRAIVENANCVVVELSCEEYYTGQARIDEVFKILYDLQFVLVDIGYIWRENYGSQNKMLQFDGIFLKKKKQ